MSKVFLCRETRRELFRLLTRASLARHLARDAAEHGWSTAEFYREENRRYLREARALVAIDNREVRADGPVQVSETAAFRRLHVLCLLGNGAADTAGQPVFRLLPARPAGVQGRLMELSPTCAVLSTLADRSAGSLLVHRSECGQADAMRLGLHRPAATTAEALK